MPSTTMFSPAAAISTPRSIVLRYLDSSAITWSEGNIPMTASGFLQTTQVGKQRQVQKLRGTLLKCMWRWSSPLTAPNRADDSYQGDHHAYIWQPVLSSAQSPGF